MSSAPRLTALGATVVHVPLIEIAEPLDGGVALHQALARLAAFDWLVVTSANGARRAGPAAADHPAVRLAAVGPATAAALAAAASGRDVDLVPALAQAEGLLAAFPRQPARVLLAQADRARSRARRRARRDGAHGRDRDGVPHDQPGAGRRRGRPARATSTPSSSPAARRLPAGRRSTRRRGPSSSPSGPVTAAAATARGVPVDHVASSPDVAAVSDLLERVVP